MNIMKFMVGATLFATPLFALTQTATSVTFQGRIVAETCVATVNGDASATVTLPTVATTALTTAGATTGLTPFTVVLSECTPPGVGDGPQYINTVFQAQGTPTTGGNLANTGSAENVAVQLTTDSTGATPIDLNAGGGTPGLVLPEGETTTSHTFGAQYITETGAATPGLVNATVDYTLEYL